MSEHSDFFDRIVAALWHADGHTDDEWHDPTIGDDRALYKKRAEYVVAITGPVDPLYTTESTAKIFAVTVQTIQDWIHAEKIGAMKVNGYWRIPRSEILRVSNDRHG
jgi:excisionase family DNA binding protein